MKKIGYIACCLLLLFTACNEDELVVSGEPESEVVTEENVEESNGCTNSNNESAIANEILDLVNSHRQSKGKSMLELSCVATTLAIEHTQYMIAQDRISHEGFNDRFKVLQQQVNATGAGENVASGYASAESVMNGWLNSDGHRENIEGNFTHIGIAAVRNSAGRLFYTQIFYR